MSFSTRLLCWNVASASKKGGPFQVAQASVLESPFLPLIE